MAVSRVVRRAGGGRRRGARALPPAGPSQGARRQGTVRRPAGRGHPLRARLPEGARRRPRLAPLRARRRGQLPAAALARRARHERRPGRPRRALRVRQVARPLRGHRHRGEPARHLPRRAAVAWQERERGLQAAEPPAHPHGLERLLPAGGERAVAPGPRERRWRRPCGSSGTTCRSSTTHRRRSPFLKKKPKVAEKLAPFARR